MVNYLNTGSPDGYDGSTYYEPVEYNVDYNIGSDGGQFVFTISGSQLGRGGRMSEEDG